MPNYDDPEELEKEFTKSYQQGVVAGYTQASNYLMEHSTEAWRQNRDNDARLLRELSGYMRRRAAEYAPKKD